MIRPLLTALIEYLLMYFVLKHGTKHKWIIGAVLFFLATYQLGEVVIFLTQGNELGFKIAYIATTLLPPLGVLLAEKVIKRPLGYPLFQLIALYFVFLVLIIPQVALKFELGAYCVRIFEYNPLLIQFWPYYYQGTLLFTMLALAWGAWKNKTAKAREVAKKILIAYLSFNGLAFVISYIEPWFGASFASLMCALALFAAFIFTGIALEGNFKKITLFKTISLRGR